MLSTLDNSWPAGPDAEEACDFVVFPPSGPGFRGEPALRQVEEFLSSRFPGLGFQALADAPPIERYQVVPIVGVAGDEPDVIKPLRFPSRAIMMAIAASLDGYVPQTGRGLN